MKKILLLSFLLTGCATNGGIFDAHFWVGKSDKAVVAVKDTVEEVVDVVTTPAVPEKPKPLKKFHWDKDRIVCFTFDDNGEKVDCPMGI